jgi:hypothetical protein
MPNESCFVRSAHFNRGKGNARGGVLQAQNGGTHKRLKRSPCSRAEKGELGRGLKSSVSFRANSPLLENVIIAFLLAVPKSYSRPFAQSHRHYYYQQSSDMLKIAYS